MQIFKNIVTGWNYIFVNFLIVLLLTPFILDTLGKERYGLWALILGIISFYNLLDMGVTSAIRRYYSQAIGRGDKTGQIIIFSNIYVIYLTIALIILIISFFFSHLGQTVFQISSEHLYDFQVVLLVLGLNTATIFVVKIYGGVLAANERYDIVNMVETIGSVLQGSLIYFVLSRGHGIVSMAYVLLAVTIVKGLLNQYIMYHKFPFLEVRLGMLNRKTTKMIFDYSIVSFLIILCDMFRINLDIILVGSFISLSAVTYYSIAAQFILYYTLIARTITATYVPRLSRLEGEGDWSLLRKEFLTGVKWSSTLVLFIGVNLILFGDIFIKLWLGEGYETTYAILLILGPAATITLGESLMVSLFFSTNNHSIYAKISIGEAIANVILSISLIPVFGIYAVAIGTLIPTLVVKLTIQPRLACKIISITTKDLFRASYAQPIGFALFYGGIIWLLLQYIAVHVQNFFGFISAAFVATLLAVLLAYTICASPAERVCAKRLLARIFKRLLARILMIK